MRKKTYFLCIVYMHKLIFCTSFYCFYRTAHNTVTTTFETDSADTLVSKYI